jgi:23S rRNA G2445 N2-methylase RlmL
MVTPSCGAGTLTIEEAEKVMKLTGEISAAMRQKYN